MATSSLRTESLGHIFDADGAPFRASGTPLSLPTTGAPASDQQPTMLTTGIKVVDLFAPLRRGGPHQVSAPTGVGKAVILAEIINNLGHHDGGCAVWVAPIEQGAEGNQMIQEFRESGVLGFIAVVLARPGEAEKALRTGTHLARALAADGGPTLLGIESDLLDATTATLLPQSDHVTRLVISESDEPAPLPAPLHADGAILFSRDLAKQSIWPAVDPVRSSARLIADGTLPEDHLRVARAAREVLTSQPDSARARRLLRFGTQPFTVAEPFTARPGVYVPLAEVIAGYASILRGEWDDVPEEQLEWQGGLPERPR